MDRRVKRGLMFIATLFAIICIVALWPWAIVPIAAIGVIIYALRQLPEGRK